MISAGLIIEILTTKGAGALGKLLLKAGKGTKALKILGKYDDFIKVANKLDKIDKLDETIDGSVIKVKGGYYCKLKDTDDYVFVSKKSIKDSARFEEALKIANKLDNKFDNMTPEMFDKMVNYGLRIGSTLKGGIDNLMSI